MDTNWNKFKCILKATAIGRKFSFLELGSCFLLRPQFSNLNLNFILVLFSPRASEILIILIIKLRILPHILLSDKITVIILKRKGKQQIVNLLQFGIVSNGRIQV